MILFRLNFFLFCLLLNQVGSTQDPTIDRLDSLFAHMEANDQAMGSISIYKDGQPYFMKVVGYANIEADKKATIVHRYKIGSISKTYTATMIMQLVEEGMLSLDDSLAEFYPEVENAERITIRQLLGHRSGIKEYLDNLDESDLAVAVKKDQLLARIYKAESQFQPDSKFEYSNSNYLLLGCILEDVTNLSYADLLHERITFSIGLSATKSGNRSLNEKRTTNSYRKTDKWELTEPWDMSWAFGAGDITSTPLEVNIFLDYLFSGKLVSKESVALMMDLNEGYGLGMFAVPFGNSKGYGHNGLIENFSSSAYVFEDLGIGLCYISNGEVMPTNDILLAVLSIMTGLPYAFPDFTEKETVIVALDELKTYVGDYSSATFPLDVKVFIDDETLMAQATGQGPFPLTGVGEGEFVFVKAGIEIQFDSGKKELVLRQAGMTNVFQKE